MRQVRVLSSLKGLISLEKSCVSYLVATDACSLQSLGGQLLVLIGNKVNAQRELVDAGLLATEIVDPDLGIGDTTAEPRLGVRLILTIAVASCGTSAHLESFWSTEKNE